MEINKEDILCILLRVIGSHPVNEDTHFSQLNFRAISFSDTMAKSIRDIRDYYPDIDWKYFIAAFEGRLQFYFREKDGKVMPANNFFFSDIPNMVEQAFQLSTGQREKRPKRIDADHS